MGWLLGRGALLAALLAATALAGAAAFQEAVRVPGLVPMTHAMDWTKAVSTCESKGKRLCLSREICQAGLKGSGPKHFAPAGDGYNKWVYVGSDAGRRKKCEIAVRPKWNPAQQKEHRGTLFCCSEKMEKLGTKPTWQEAHDHCARKGMQLCSQQDYCHNGVPRMGIRQVAQWAPIRDKGWVALGHGFPHSKLCKTFAEITKSTRPAPFGMTKGKGPHRDRGLCCPKKGPPPKPAPRIVAPKIRPPPPPRRRRRIHRRRRRFRRLRRRLRKLRRPRLPKKLLKQLKAAKKKARALARAAKRKIRPRRAARIAKKKAKRDKRRLRKDRKKVAVLRKQAAVKKAQARDVKKVNHDASRIAALKAENEYVRQLQAATMEMQKNVTAEFAAVAAQIAAAQKQQEQNMAASPANLPITAEIYPKKGERHREYRRKVRDSPELQKAEAAKAAAAAAAAAPQLVPGRLTPGVRKQDLLYFSD